MKRFNIYILFLFLGIVYVEHVHSAEFIKILKVNYDNSILAITKRGKKRIGLLGTHIPNYNEIEMRLRRMDLFKEERKNQFSIRKKANKFLKQVLKKGNLLNIKLYRRLDPLYKMPLYLVQLSNEKILNLELVKKGFAYIKEKELNPEWKKKFKQALHIAIQKRKGFWLLWKEEENFRKKTKNTALNYSYLKTINVLSYNVENLFDTNKDPFHKDHVFLPIHKKQNEKHIKFCMKQRSRRFECLKMDWSEALLQKKMKRLAEVIFQKKEKKPHILILQEIENYTILKRLVDEYFKDNLYEIHHFESRDYRGIDVAILSNLKLAQTPRYYEIPFKAFKRTRGILETTFFLPNKELITVFGFHFPSQRSGIEARKQSVSFLNNIRKQLPKKRLVIAGGDSNITVLEEKKIYPEYIYKNWEVSHKKGCKKCIGTIYYPPLDQWSFFDVFYYSRDQKKSFWKFDPTSVEILNNVSYQNTEQKIPNDYRIPDFKGVSDHWPIMMQIKKRRNDTQREKK